MTLFKLGKTLFWASSLALFCSFSAKAQNNPDTNSVHAIDTLNFENLLNEQPVKPALTPASNNNAVQEAPAEKTVIAQPDTSHPAAPANSSDNNAAAPSAPVASPANNEPANTAAGTPVSAPVEAPANNTTQVESSMPGANSEETQATRARTKTFIGLNRYRTFSIGAEVGMGKIGGVGFSDYAKNTPSPGFGLVLNYYLGRVMSLQAAFHMQTDMKGDSLFRNPGPDFGHSYVTNSMDFSLNAVFSLGTINFISKKNRLGFYALTGIGSSSFTTSKVVKSDLIQSSKATRSSLFIPVGLGVKFKVTNDITANAGVTIKFLDTDGFDNTYYNTNTDKVSYVYVGMSYALGKKNKPYVEWTNPVQGMYEDLAGGAQNAQLRKKVVSLQEQIDSLEMRMNSKIDSLKVDTDGDGVPDFIDKDNSTPKGAMVDASGKALDSDGDGIIDLYDRCPFEKGTAAFNGCKKQPMKTTQKEQNAVKNAENKIFFIKNSYQLNDEATASLKNLVDIMKKNPGYKLLISGYTDADGDKELNERLSLERANSVKKFMEKEGIESSRLKTQGLGEKVFLDNNITSAGKQQNRVVTLEFVMF